MECTQRLEDTQELYSTFSERVCPEQIGFLGICGTKYPVVKGPNKIGRDPQTCSIVLNMNSISRQHAILNVLSNKEFMIMDLDSANKTKLMGKNVQPYIPHPLNNGDMVQFGDAFGVFRLLEEDNDLPMTQAMDIPETPVANRFVSRLTHAQTTTIPESPEASDKDESFIMASQSRGSISFKSSKECFIKPSAKTISIQPIGSNKIDNVYWNSKNKSVSFNDSGAVLNDINTSSKLGNNKIDDIYDMETQIPFADNRNESVDSIYNADTQLPNLESPSIHSLDTQLPPGTNLQAKLSSPAIHSLNTQMPTSQLSSDIHTLDTQLPENSQLPTVCKFSPSMHCKKTQLIPLNKITDEKKIDKDIFSANKENDISIFNAETQPVSIEENDIIATKLKANESMVADKHLNDNKFDESNEIILFEEVDSQLISDEFESQPLVIPDMPLKEKFITTITQQINENEDSGKKKKNQSMSNNVQIIESDTDCEDIDILPTQNILQNPVDDDLTDCDDDLDELNKPVKKGFVINQNNFEDMATQIIEEVEISKTHHTSTINFEDMPTQLIEGENVNDQTIKDKCNLIQNIEDMPTQVLTEHNPTDNQLIANKAISPFKVPTSRVFKKRGVPSNNTEAKESVSKSGIDYENYYKATQDIFKDLCSQNKTTPERITVNDKTIVKSGVGDSESQVKSYVSNLSEEQIRDVIGVNANVAGLKKMPSDGSDVELTPKKVYPFKFADLPNSQEIKSAVSYNNTTRIVTESSSESEIENDSEEQYTPILFRTKKRKHKNEARQDLSKMFDVDALPTRVITRVRKPTSKIRDAEEKTKRNNENILRPTYLTEQEDCIDNEIINENILKLKSKNNKTKTNKDNSLGKRKGNESSCKEGLVSVNSTLNIESSKEPREKRRPGRPKKSEAMPKNADNLTNSKSESSLSRNRDSSKLKTADVTDIGRCARHKSRKEEKNVPKSNKKDNETCRKKRVKIPEEPQERSASPEVTRRITRRSTKTKEVERKTAKNNSPRNNSLKYDKSMVYNISSESGIDSPKVMKRSADDFQFEPKSKRTRSKADNITIPYNYTPIPHRLMKTQRVLFTAFPLVNVKDKLEKLGACIATEVNECTVLLTMKIKRTFKLLCAIGLGKPIVGPSWVQACVDNNTIVDPWLHILKDNEAEAKFKFNLEETLRGQRNYLSGYNVSSTPNVLPKSHEMKFIVESSGGTWKEGGANWVCVSSTKDMALWPGLKSRGANIVSTEFILGGVLHQRADIYRNIFS